MSLIVAIVASNESILQAAAKVSRSFIAKHGVGFIGNAEAPGTLSALWRANRKYSKYSKYSKFWYT